MLIKSLERQSQKVEMQQPEIRTFKIQDQDHLRHSFVCLQVFFGAKIRIEYHGNSRAHQETESERGGRMFV